MASPLYQQFNPTQNNNLLGMIQRYRSDPMSMLMQRFNIPQNINNPNDIIQHLLNTNQVTQAQVNRAMQIGNNPNIRNMFR